MKVGKVEEGEGEVEEGEDEKRRWREKMKGSWKKLKEEKVGGSKWRKEE